jgi:hypothetical protein
VLAENENPGRAGGVLFNEVPLRAPHLRSVRPAVVPSERSFNIGLQSSREGCLVPAGWECATVCQRRARDFAIPGAFRREQGCEESRALVP